MKIAICDNMYLCTEEEVRHLLDLVSEQRREKALQYKHVFGQWSTLQAWLMLRELGLSNQPWQYNEYGKPYIVGEPFFSLSHCKEGIAVSISEKPIGIDIEGIRKAEPSLIARTMNAREQEEIAQSEHQDIAFTSLWTQKEAYLKCLGTGIVNDLHHVLENTNNIQIKTIIKSKYVYSIAEKTDHAL